MPTNSRYLRQFTVNLGLLSKPPRPGRLPLDGAHGKPPKLLLERSSFGHLPFPASDRNATFHNAVSAGIQLQTAGRPGAGDREAGEIARGWESAPNPARCYRLRKDLYHRKRDPRARPANSRHLSQQDAGGADLLRVQTILPA